MFTDSGVSVLAGDREAGDVQCSLLAGDRG